MIHPGWVDEDGVLHIARPDLYEGELAGLAGRRVKVTVKRAVPTRSISQNSWYWGVLLRTAAAETGNDIHDIHEALKELHLVPKVHDVLGRRRLSYTTTDLTVEQMSEYLEKCRATLAQFGVSLPVED